MWATNPSFQLLTIFLGGERTTFPDLVFRDEKSCCITQEIGGVQTVEWVRVLLGAALEVFGGGGKLENTNNSVSLFSKYWLPSRNSAI